MHTILSAENKFLEKDEQYFSSPISTKQGENPSDAHDYLVISLIHWPPDTLYSIFLTFDTQEQT